MAEFIELNDDEGNADNITNDTTSQEPTQVDTSESVVPEQQIPSKYQGKSVEEIIRMHEEAEKMIGRQAQEVGEVRKLADELIKQQLNATQKKDTQPSVEHNEIDFFEDPATAVNKAVENNPVLKQIKEQQEAQIRQQGAEMLQKRFPNFQEIVTSDEFADWIKGSKVRIDLFAKANNYDIDSAVELLETFTTIKGIKAQKAQAADETLKKVDDEQRSNSLKAAAIQKGGTGESSKPIYRRVDLIRLRMNDPDRYNAMQDEILAAYSEGRVK